MKDDDFNPDGTMKREGSIVNQSNDLDYNADEYDRQLEEERKLKRRASKRVKVL